jgi:hypothetical protein
LCAQAFAQKEEVMHYFKAVLLLLIIALAGCSSTKQLVPIPSTQAVPQQQVRISIKGNRYIYPPFTIKDGSNEIGEIGRDGALIWERPAGRCCIKASFAQDGGVFGLPGQRAGLLCTFMADLAGGRQYTFDLVRNQGIFSFQPTPDSAAGVMQIHLPVCILPVIDVTGGKGINLNKYADAYKLPKVRTGSYFPANWASEEMIAWNYTKPFYGGENADTTAIYESAKRGVVATPMLSSGKQPAYYMLIAVKQFEDFFRVVWLAESTVECYVIRSADGKVVYQGTGHGTGRGRTLDVDKKALISAHPAYSNMDGDAWQQAIYSATINALKDMPVLTP